MIYKAYALICLLKCAIIRAERRWKNENRVKKHINARKL